MIHHLRVDVLSRINYDSGFIVDMMELNKVVHENVIKIMDHSQIEEDIGWFKDKQPSTENLVVYIWTQIADKIPKPAYLYSIKLRETPTIYTEYYGPEGEK